MRRFQNRDLATPQACYLKCLSVKVTKFLFWSHYREIIGGTFSKFTKLSSWLTLSFLYFTTVYLKWGAQSWWRPESLTRVWRCGRWVGEWVLGQDVPVYHHCTRVWKTSPVFIKQFYTNSWHDMICSVKLFTATVKKSSDNSEEHSE